MEKRRPPQVREFTIGQEDRRLSHQRDRLQWFGNEAGAIRGFALMESESDRLLRRLAPAPEKLAEKRASDEPFSTFSLHVSDVSFKLAQVRALI